MRARLLLVPCLVAVAACAPEAAGGGAAAAPQAGWSLDAGGDLNGFFDCLEAAGASLVAAHRGGPARGFPENALETFANTLAQAPALLEVDVAQSSDGVLYLMHDDTLERTTDGGGAAGALSWAEIAGLRLKDETGNLTDFAPPRLDAVVAWARGRTILELDIKRSTDYAALAETLRRQNAERGVILIAYSLGQARKMHRLMPEAMISLPLASQSALNEAVAAGIPADRLLGFTGLDEPDARLFDILERRGVETIFATLGGRDSLDLRMRASGDDGLYADIAAMGADIIATDRPRAAHAALEAAGRAAQSGECGVVFSVD
jgi:glycerophosphoryl diester phosphodiesterase